MKKPIPALVLSLTMIASLCIPSAYALDYGYTGPSPGSGFYQSTSESTDYVADSSTIVVGDDGTITTNTQKAVSYTPLSALDIPVGDYPDSWGAETDVAIAQSSIFANYLAPTTQQSTSVEFLSPDFTQILNGALPTPATYPYAYYIGSQMPQITEDGAIAKLEIPSLSISSYIYEGTSQAEMAKGIGHFECTPAWGTGNIALAGHNNPWYRPFHKLRNIQVGDTVLYTTAYGTRTYVVSEITTCKTTDTSGLLQNGQDKLTMYTCKVGQPSVKQCVIATLVK